MIKFSYPNFPLNYNANFIDNETGCYVICSLSYINICGTSASRGVELISPDRFLLNVRICFEGFYKKEKSRVLCIRPPSIIIRVQAHVHAPYTRRCGFAGSSNGVNFSRLLKQKTDGEVTA